MSGCLEVLDSRRWSGEEMRKCGMYENSGGHTWAVVRKGFQNVGARTTRSCLYSGVAGGDGCGRSTMPWDSRRLNCAGRSSDS